MRITKRIRFPWIPLLLFLGSVFLFWVLPSQMGEKPIQVEFSDKK